MSDDELITACLARDPLAQRALYDRYAARLNAVAFRYLRRVELAEDVLAEAWIKIFTNLHKYTGEGNFEGWLRRIVANESLMYLRKRRLATTELSDAVVAVTPAEARLTDVLEEADVLRLLDAIPEGCRQIFCLYELDGLKHREIADLLEVSINTSKSQLILAKRKLREVYNDLSLREGRHLRPLPASATRADNSQTETR